MCYTYSCFYNISFRLLQWLILWLACLSNSQTTTHSERRRSFTVCSIPRSSYITPVLSDLHWRPIKFRVIFKILTLTFKAIHGLPPKYMADLIAIKNHSCYNLRSSKELLLAHTPNKLKPTLGVRTFTYAALTEWNSLPSTLRNIAAIDIFKKHLKTYCLLRLIIVNNNHLIFVNYFR